MKISFLFFIFCICLKVFNTDAQSFSGTINLGKSSLGINFENKPNYGTATGLQIVDIGDMNGDGYGDAVVESACALYVIFGSYSAISVDLQYLMSPNGFNITGPFGSTCYDLSVTALGDINGDEFADILVGNTDGTVNPIVPYYYIILGDISLKNVNLNNVEGNSQVISIVYNGMYDYASPSRRLSAVDTDSYQEQVHAHKKKQKSVSLSKRKEQTTAVPSSPNAQALLDISLSTDDYCPYTDYEINYVYIPVSSMDVYELQIYLGISGLGDVNNDGYNDLILMHSLTPSDTTMTFSVVFGGPSLNATINLTALTSSEGFTIIGDGNTYPTIVSTDTRYDTYNTSCVTNSTSGKVTYVVTYTYYQYYIYAYEVAAGWSGDINHDGYDDILLGSGYAHDFAGEVFVLYGKSNFSSVFYLSSLSESDGFIIYGAGKQNSLYDGDQTGLAVTGNFDFNNDGIDDMLIGAPYANAYLGICYIIFGTSGSFDLTNNGLYLETLNPDQGIGIYASTLSALGYSVSRAGDYSGDGVDDIIIGAPGAGGGAGIAYILYGSTGQNSNIQISTLTESQAKEIIGIKNTNPDNSYCQTGFAVSGGSDFNRDGLSDVFVGAPYQEAGYEGVYSNAGAGYCIFGTSTESLTLYLRYLTTVYTYSAASTTTSTPIAVNMVGDINNNGYEDFAIGTFLQASSYVILSSVTGYQSVSSLSQLDTELGYSVKSNITSSWLGFSVNGAGDMNGDGLTDWVIGAPNEFYYSYRTIEPFYYSYPYATSSATGYVYVVYGSSYSADITVTNSHLPANAGVTIQGLPGSGLGASVAGIGNFNKLKGTTKLGSIAIGAPLYSSSYPSSGIIYLISGSYSLPSSINLADYSDIYSSIPIITIVGDPTCSGLLGWSVASAGDINSDGFQDIIFSAPSGNNNLNPNITVYETGMIYILLGGNYLNQSQTLYTQLLPSASYAISITGANAYDEAGFSVSGIGDFNGDGYADYAIGAPFAKLFAGITYVLFGSSNPSNSISLSTIGTNFAQGFYLTGQNGNDYSGWNLASAGDINHDGLADFIVSAPGANTYSGTVYIIYGAHSMSSNIDLGSLTSTQGLIILNNILYTDVGWTVASYSDKKGNSLVLLGNNPTAANKGTGIAYAIVPNSVPVNQTVAPTPKPTAAPTEYPTYTPTFKPTTSIPTFSPTSAPTLPPFWSANQGIILGVVIPATTSFIPIYFSKQICFYSLEHWSAANHKRGLFQIGIYNMCKKIYLADFVESKSIKKAKKDIDKEELARESNLKPNIELKVMEKLKKMKDNDEENGVVVAVVNPMNQGQGLIYDAEDPQSSSSSAPGEMDRTSISNRPASFRKVSAIQNDPLTGPDGPKRTSSLSMFRVSEAMIDSDDEDEERGGGGAGNNDVIVKAVYSLHYEHPEIQLLLQEGKFKTSTILSQSFFVKDIDVIPSVTEDKKPLRLTTIPHPTETEPIVDGHVAGVEGHYNWFEDIALVRYLFRVILIPLFQQTDHHIPLMSSFFFFFLDSKILLIAGHFLVEMFLLFSSTFAQKEREEEGREAKSNRQGSSLYRSGLFSVLRTVLFAVRLLMVSWLQQWFYPSPLITPALSDHAGYCASITVVYSLQVMLSTSSFFPSLLPRFAALSECFFLQSQQSSYLPHSSSSLGGGDWMLLWLPILVDVSFLSVNFLRHRSREGSEGGREKSWWWLVMKQLVMVDYSCRLVLMLLISLLT